MNKKKVLSGVAIAGVVLLVVVLVVVGLAKKRRADQEAEMKYDFQKSAQPVIVESAKAVRSPQMQGYPGTVRATEESALSFRVGGPLITVDVLLGKPVKAGTLLMQIDPRDYEDRIAALEAQLAGAQAVMNNAQQDYDRAKTLFNEEVIAQAAFDHATSSLDSAKAAVRNLDAQLQIARHSLADTELRAPYNGRVTAQLAENHEIVTSGAVVLRYHDIEWLEVTVDVPENEIIYRSMESGSPARVSFPAAPGKIYDAELKEWSSAADAMTRTYAVTFRFKAPQEIKVLPGMSAEVAWADDTSAELQVTVPVSALASHADGRSFVWIYDEHSNTAEQRTVQTGALSGTSRIVVLSGLTDGDPVIVSGSRLIHKDQPLKKADVN